MIVTPNTYESVLDKLSMSDLLGCDTETSGLEWTDRLFSVIFADDREEFYFDKSVLGEDHFRRLDFLFYRKERTFIFKNAKFDMRMLRWENLLCNGRVEDIGIAARILKNDFYGPKSYSLDALAAREGMEKLKIVEDYIKANKLYEVRKSRLGEEYKQPQFNRVPLEIISEYACKDARLTYDLRKIYRQRMDISDQQVYNNECDLIKVCFDMEIRGIKLDLDYTARGMEYEEDQLKQKKRHFLQGTGKEYQDSKSVLVPLFEAAGETIPQTDKGNPSLTDAILESFESPVAKIVQDIRYSEKRISTYYANYINGYDSNEYIHPSMWQEGTRTGRFSYSNPNLQNIPKEEKSEDPYVIRACFIPSPGNVFISMDYKQMEYRMMLAYANERRLIREVMNGADIHQATAELLGISRSFAKTLNFAILYGAGPDKISRMLSITVGEASRLRTKYFLGLPKVERLINDVIGAGRNRGYVSSWFGRKLRADREFCYALPNHLIQGGCADVVKIAMNKIAPVLEGTRSRMVLQVHDQLLFDMHPADNVLVPKIKDIMENVWPEMNGMKLYVDVKWSDKSFAERDMYEWNQNLSRVGDLQQGLPQDLSLPNA
jgi:DNA polymerase-1